MLIVKRKGHQEEFDERKVYASVFAACLVAHVTNEDAEIIADKVSKQIISWLKDEKEVTSHQIFTKVTQELKILTKEASFMYSTHRDVS